MVDLNKLYENYLILFFEVNYKNTSFISDKKHDYDQIYEYINYFWQAKYGNKLDISKEENKEKLYDFVDDIFRYKLLNDNLKLIYNTSIEDSKNEFMKNNYQKMITIVKNVMYDIKDYNDVDIKDLPELSNGDLDRLFTEFLFQIDSSKELLELYNNLKKENRFILLDALDEEEADRVRKKFNITKGEYNDYLLVLETGESFIILDRKHNIQDLFTLTHEFMHYYAFYNNKDIKPNYLLQEFPSIFFETLMCNFLFEKGYDTKKVSELSCYRLNHLNSFSSAISAVTYYMSIFLNHGSVDKEIDEVELNKKINKLIKENGEDGYNKLKVENQINDDLSKMTKDYCNFANYYMSVEPRIINNGYSYTVGYYLAMHYLARFYQNDMPMSEMIEITKNLSTINLDELFDFSNDKCKKKEK